jgi:hypothetical protein
MEMAERDQAQETSRFSTRDMGFERLSMSVN